MKVTINKRRKTPGPFSTRINGKLDYTEALKYNLPKIGTKINLLVDTLSPTSQKLIPFLGHEEKKEIYIKQLTKLLQTNPDGEYWVPLYYFVYNDLAIKRSKKIKEDRHFDYAFISNKGRVFDARKLEIKEINNSKSRYRSGVLEYYSFTLHRAVACSWIPKPVELNAKQYSELEVNHIDAVKYNCDVFNLEWRTGEENVNHAIKNNLMINHKGVKHGTAKPMMGVVVDITGFKRKKIYVCGREECLQYGLSNKVLYKLRKGQIKTYRGCEWKEITLNEYIRNREVPDPALLEQINNYRFERTGKGSARADKNVWKLTHIRTKHVRIISGTIEQRKLGMRHDDLAKAAESKKPYKNYLVEKQIAR